MAKHATKVAAALNARKNAHVAHMPSGQRCVMPGSQNRKKGYGGKRSGR
jgi:hypothetical protein